MQEVKIKDNDLGIPIYFEDTPVFSSIPDSAINLLMQDLESEIRSKKALSSIRANRISSILSAAASEAGT